MSQPVQQPRSRTSSLVVKEIHDEVLVYDLEAQRAHSLNRAAAAVWRACDGTRDVAALSLAAGDAGHAVQPEAVRYALRALGRARLLDGPVDESGLTRRQMMARLGATAAFALPIVTTIVAPTAAQAQSPTCFRENQGPCTSVQQCCPNACGGFPCLCIFSKDRFRCVRPTVD